MSKNKSSVLFLGKKNDKHCVAALNFATKNFENVQSHLGEWGELLPEEIKSWEGDYIISYLSRWIVPEYLIKRAKIAAINFHAASPNYPGMGCINFALYEEAKEYGATCHYMNPKVDTGKIVSVKRFPIFDSDNVESLLARTYDFQLVLFYEVVEKMINECELQHSSEEWSRKPFTRNELNELYTITPTMNEAEIKKRIRATSFGIWQPEIRVHDYIFQLKKTD